MAMTSKVSQGQICISRHLFLQVEAQAHKKAKQATGKDQESFKGVANVLDEDKKDIYG